MCVNTNAPISKASEVDCAGGMGAVKWPASLRRVKALAPRTLLFGVIGLEYLLFAPLYAYVGQWCYSTVGEPYAAALAHYNDTAIHVC